MKKLIRHKMLNNVSFGTTHVETDPRLLKLFAWAKIHEEVLEIAGARGKDVNEYVDLIEAVEFLASLYGFTGTDLHNARCAKQAKSGMIARGVIWDSEGRQEIEEKQGLAVSD